MQYSESLPLADHEVVLTFDDGPLPPHTSRVLDILAAECIKATFFMVGRQALGFPQLVRRAANEGHTIANHSQNHPLTFHKMAVDQAAREIEDGFLALRSVLVDRGAVAPFFRIPGLRRQVSVEMYLRSSDVMTWSVDFLADDWWKKIKPKEIARRAIERIEAKGRGILLLHDIQPATAAALPDLLKELKARGYRIVHVVPATSERPATTTAPEQWVRHMPHTPKPRSVPVVGLEPSADESVVPQSPVALRWLPMPVPQVVQSFDAFGRPAKAAPLEVRDAGAKPAAEFSAAPRPAAGPLRQLATAPSKTEPTKPAATAMHSAAAPASARARNARKPLGARRPLGHQLSLPRPTAGLSPWPMIR